MNDNPKIVISGLGILLGGFIFIYGAVLPLLKSQAYIDAARGVASVHTIQDFENNFNNVFNFYSPVGGEESSKFLLSNILGVISNQPDQQENVTRELINYIEPKIYPDTRQYIAMANLYTIALTRFKQESDYNSAIDYYKKARINGPKLPPVLYGLFALYQATDDRANMKEVGDTILKYWPDDIRIEAALALGGVNNK